MQDTDNELKNQTTPIFVGIGRIVQGSQQMELAIGLSLTLLRRLNSNIFLDSEFEGSISYFSKATLGHLISEIKKHISLSSDQIAALKLALAERNYIVHAFFNENSEHFITSEGRVFLMDRIKTAKRNIDPGFKILDDIVGGLLSASGISIDELTKEIASKIRV